MEPAVEPGAPGGGVVPITGLALRTNAPTVRGNYRLRECRCVTPAPPDAGVTERATNNGDCGSIAVSNSQCHPEPKGPLTCGFIEDWLVEVMGLEPTTSTLRT